MPPSLVDLIDHELTKRWHEPRGEVLRQLYRERLDTVQRKDVRAAVWIVGILYMVFSFTDAVLISDVLIFTVPARFVIGVIFIAGINFQVAHRMPMPIIDQQCATAVVIGYGVWLWLASNSSHHLTASYYLTFGIIFMMVSNLFFNFGFRLAMMTSGIIAASCFTALILVFEVSLPYAVAVGTLYVATYALTLFVNWKLNHERYRVFLNAIQAEIRQQEVEQRGAALLRLSTTDAMTGLANRRATDEALRTHWEAWQGAGESFGVILIDIDYFKRFNDHYGHQEGDRCLVAVARAMEEAIAGHPATLGRFGGEEFILMMRAPDRTCMADLAEAVRRNVESMGIPHDQRPDRSSVITVSVGAAFSADITGTKVERLVTEADRALYGAKANDRNCVQVFDRDDPDRLDLHDSVADLVRTALAQNRVALAYQPIVDARTGEVVAAEALMRLTAPNGTAVSPGTFIPVAERNGMIVELGKWAIRTVCRDLLASGLLPRASVNVSAVQFRAPGFPLAVAAILAETGVAPDRLALEVTEGLEIESQPDVLAGMDELRKLGVKIWLDDFGTGFAGLSCIRSVPFDAVKLDRSFLHDSSTPRGAQMLADMIALVRNAGFATVIEGIEGPHHLDQLDGWQIDLLQGFHLGRPMSVEALRSFLAERRARPDEAAA